MDFDPATGGLKCPQCGHTQSIAAAQTAVAERDLSTALSDAGKAHGYGREMKAVKCSACGATTQVDPAVASTMCPFCGSPQVLEQKPDPNIIQPEAVIPFQLTGDQAYQNYKKWLGKGFFRPKDVLQKSGAAQMQGVYLPFWTFDAHAESRWTAESGDYYYETERYTTTENGKRVTRTRQVRKVRWYPSSGHHADDYDDVLVSGTTSGDQAMLKKIYPFETGKLLPYKPDYLSGWAAEAYRIPLADAWKSGQEVIRKEERNKCDKQVPGDTHRNLNVRTQLSQTTYKHVLLPVFLANYRYNTKLYHFMVNGQTGEVQGQAPIDWIKVAIVVVIVLAILLVVLFVLSQTQGGSGDSLRPVLQYAVVMIQTPFDFAQGAAAPPLLL
jgi:predicted RNA-binding Zn-ribbon protein involved in translation (DUF1610 family)